MQQHLQRTRARRNEKNNVSTACYLLSPTKLSPQLQGDPGLPLTSEVHMRVAPWMYPLTPPAFQKCSTEDARKHTRISLNYLMHVPGTQVVVISNCSVPTFIRGGESCMKSIGFKFGKIYCQYTKDRCCCSSRKAPSTPLRFTNRKELTPFCSPRIIIWFGTILRYFCLFSIYTSALS